MPLQEQQEELSASHSCFLQLYEGIYNQYRMIYQAGSM